MTEAWRPKLVELVQARLRPALSEGDIAVDATLGNGRDCAFLAAAVGESGRVYGFDVQAVALERARQTLGPLLARCRLLLAGHETLLEVVPAVEHGRVAVVVFNLGYLPGGDKRCVTRGETTLPALAAALNLLAPGGLLSVLAYTGHPGGRQEAEAVKAWAQARRAEGCEVELSIPSSVSGSAPEWVLIRKLLSGYTGPPEFH